MSNPKIQSGSELDWEIVRKAAKGILKAADDANYVAPDYLQKHIMLVNRVCEAMDSIKDGLKLRYLNKHEMVGTDECSLFNSEHPHANGMAIVKCLCGWKSHPVQSRSAEIIFATHVQQETNAAIVEAAEHGKALAGE